MAQGEGILEANDLQSIVDLIAAVQSRTPEDVSRLAPEHRMIVKNMAAEYAGKIPLREKAMLAVMPEYYDKMKQLLVEQTEFLENGRVVFAGGDINPSNIIKAGDRLAVVDWERMRLVNSEALDYDFLYTSLWNQPELQAAFLETVKARHADEPHVLEQLRLDFIFYRGSGELKYWWELGQKTQIPEEREKAARGVATLSRQLAEAIDRQGPWKA